MLQPNLPAKDVFWPAALAGLGYVGALIITSAVKWRNHRLKRQRGLMKLGLLLKTMRAAFAVQVKHRDHLYKSLQSRSPLRDEGYEHCFIRCYDLMTGAEREVHAIIRGITMNTLKPLNDKAMEWLAADTFYRSRFGTDGQKKLNASLNQLDIHFWLWNAKYQTSIPERPEHSLVYLADENNEGVGFPSGVEEWVDAEVGSRNSR